MKKSLFILASLLLLASCGDDPKPQYTPKILSLKVECAPNNSLLVLDRIEALVEDQNGVNDLIVNPDMPDTSKAKAKILSTLLTLSADPIYPEAAMNITNKAVCKEAACLVLYTWTASAEADSSKRMMSCGENGDGLSLELSIEDQAGYYVIGTKTSTKEFKTSSLIMRF